MGSVALNKIKLLLLFTVLYTVFYIVPNLWPVSTPSMLPLFAIDKSVPLIPWTFIIYLSDYLMLATIIVLVKWEDYLVLSRRAILGLVFCGSFFYLMPTTYPRPEYPEVSNAFVYFCMHLVGGADTPNNCFPSMHVAMAVIGAWQSRCLGQKAFIFYIFWTLAIVATTLTTKQHYAVDILGGFTVAVVAIYVEYAFLRKRLFTTFGVSPL